MKRAAIRGLDLVTVPPRVEAALWRRLRFEQEARCRELLFDRYHGFARAIALRRFGRRPRRGIEQGDVEQFAYEGLLQAIDRFDPVGGAPFTAFARRRILGNIVDGAARMSEVDAQNGFRRRIEQERARSLADAGGDDPLAALAALASGLALGLMLDGVVAPADGVCARPNAYESLAWREANVLIAREIARLPEREAAIIRQHYEGGIAFTQIAASLGLSKGRVSQLHASALGRLRKRIGSR